MLLVLSSQVQDARYDHRMYNSLMRLLLMMRMRMMMLMVMVAEVVIIIEHMHV